MSETALDKFPPKESASADWDDGSPAAIWWRRQQSYQYLKSRKDEPIVFTTESTSLVPDSCGRFGDIFLAAYLPVRRPRHRLGGMRKWNKLFRQLNDMFMESIYGTTDNTK